jgi:Mrp family chromosome partitioning ATPase
MQFRAPAPPSPTPVPAVPPDLRRAISKPTWLANRARNALRRPAFIGAISIGTFVTAIVSMVVVPRAQQRQQAPVAPASRPDTFAVIAHLATLRLELAKADSALTATRAAIAAAAPSAPDTLSTASVAQRDSIRIRLERLDALLRRAEQAPLPASYRALAEVAELEGDANIKALVDSLSEIEREREGFGAVGGVDPIFVALTSRATDLGRAIQAIASARRTEMRATLAALQPVAPKVVASVGPDTAARIAERDSLIGVFRGAQTQLGQMRLAANALDQQEERVRERATAVAPPLALLASAFVLSAVIGFAVAFFGELRNPRVSESKELERFLGVRVLSTVETPMPSVERGRRQADRAAPPYFDPGAEGYQLAYLGLATDHPSVLMTTITGDDAAITAVVACNLAAIAADEARNTLVVDLDPACNASAALRARAKPGLVDILGGNAEWPDATIPARVGRDKTVDLVPFGVGARPAPEQLVAVLKRDASRLVRYYDAVFFVSPPDAAPLLPAVLPSRNVVVCAQPGITPLPALRARLEKIKESGGAIRGVVLWEAERPLLPTPQELAPRARLNASKRELAAAPV